MLLIDRVLGEALVDALQRLDLTCCFGRNESRMRIDPTFGAAKRLSLSLLVCFHRGSSPDSHALDDLMPAVNVMTARRARPAGWYGRAD
jgi:hypothetical protein